MADSIGRDICAVGPVARRLAAFWPVRHAPWFGVHGGARLASWGFTMLYKSSTDALLSFLLHHRERKMVYTVELRFPFAETDQVLPPLTMEGVVSRSPPTKPSNARSRKERRKGERAFAHQQESDTPVADMVLAELTRNTVGKAGKKKEAAKRDGKPDIKGKGKAADPERWKVSDAVWRAYGLVGDFSSSVSPTSVPAKSDGDDNADIGTSETDSDASSYDALPPWAVVVMPVYPLRLRHESSTKHVEWWARQMEKARQHAAAGGPGAAPNGPSGPHGIDRGAQPQHVGPHNSQMNAVQGGHHDRRTSGAMNAAHMSSPMRPPGGPVMQQPPNSYMNMAQWNARGDMVHQPPPGGYTGPPPGFDAYGPAQNMGVPQGPAQQQLPQQGQMRQSNNPLLPLHVLDKLSAQMGAGRAQPQQAEVTKAGPGATSQVTDVGATATPIAPKAMASAPQSAPLPSASVYVALSALPDLCPGSERYSASSPPGIEAILGRLPQGYGVVEYAILEIWPRAMLAEAVQKGEVDLRPLEELSEKERLERGQRGAEQAGQREKAKRAHDDDEEEKGESSGSESDVGPSDATAEARASGTSDAKRVRIDTPNQAQTQTPAPVVASQSEAPLGLGLDYDSDSDADEGAVEEQMDGQMQLDEAEIAAARAELLPPPGQDQEKSKGPVGIAGYGYGSDSDEEDEQGDGEGEGGGAETGLAAIARKLGFAPPRPAPTSMTTPGKGQGETRGPSEVGTAKGEGAAGEMGQAEIKAVKAEKSLLEDEREDAVDWGSDGEM